MLRRNTVPCYYKSQIKYSGIGVPSFSYVILYPDETAKDNIAVTLPAFPRSYQTEISEKSRASASP